jgi:hypothetical protein
VHVGKGDKIMKRGEVSYTDEGRKGVTNNINKQRGRGTVESEKILQIR